MTVKSIEQRLTILESLTARIEPEPEWWVDAPADLKTDVERMEARVKAAGGLSADPLMLETANRLAWFISEHAPRGGS